MVPRGALEHPAGIVYLAENETFCQPDALIRRIRGAVLRLAQQYVAALFAGGPCKETAALGEEHKVYAAPGTRAHERRGRPGIGEGEYPLERVKGEARGLCFAAADDDVFPVQAEIAVLAQDKQRVEQLP